MKEMGTYIQERRAEAGYLTQKAFADALGKDQSWVSRLERGVAKELPTPEDMALISSVLHVPVENLLAAAGYTIGMVVSDDHPLIAALRPILESRDLSERQIHQLATMVRGMVEMMEG